MTFVCYQVLLILQILSLALIILVYATLYE